MLSVQDFAGETGAMLGLVRRLAEIESPSTDKAAVDRLGAFLAQELARLGAAVQTDEQTEAGNHVVARWGAVQGQGGLLILCHMDTVWDVGTLERMPLREAGGMLYGPGVFDMKAGIALLLSAVRLLREGNAWPRRPVTAVFTSDEETGSHHSRALIERLAAGAALALVLEPPLAGGALKTERKGTGLIEMVARGRGAHAGVDHEKGTNAIEELAHHILAAQGLTDYSRGTTVNTGLVSGGTRTNIVPDEARAMADVRVAAADEVERLAQWAATRQPVLPGASIQARLNLNRPPMPRDATMIATFEWARGIGRELGLELSEGSTGGGSDGNFVAALGVPVLDGLAAHGGGGHAANEHIVIDTLPERGALIAGLITEWGLGNRD